MTTITIPSPVPADVAELAGRVVAFLTPERWCQGHLAEGAEGSAANMANATRFCAFGAAILLAGVDQAMRLTAHYRARYGSTLPADNDRLVLPIIVGRLLEMAADPATSGLGGGEEVP